MALLAVFLAVWFPDPGSSAVPVAKRAPLIPAATEDSPAARITPERTALVPRLGEIGLEAILEEGEENSDQVLNRPDHLVESIGCLLPVDDRLVRAGTSGGRRRFPDRSASLRC
ncbi:hypothetical protein [Tautonia sociabilis]|uniref:Uncharacterized protein n=1 Tax=Tautonia sociabilis TaxID=2080755 RepID=A0A432MM47_9BACT|nr:hypothetical protein [Tautonia sociabilis]RUL88196.1 hypothetical protein TsocGM_08650 [Tautonia sociabilis]